jgi:alpha-L-fucosidase
VGGDPFHPMREDAASVAADKTRDMRKYAKYLHAQVRELLTRYGKVDYLFFDFSYPDRGGALKGHEGWQSEELIKMCRDLQPGIIVNDRLDLGHMPGGSDLKTPEQFRMRRHAEVDGRPVLWETCQTFSGSWGYHRDEASWKSAEQLIWMLIDTVSKGGNLLLNVGPTARGTFDDRALARLSGMGDWMRLHSRSIYGCTEAPADLPTPENSLVTYNPKTNRAYIHLLHWPIQQFYVDGWLDKIEYAQLLNDASEVKWGPLPVWQQGHEALGGQSTILHLPVHKPNVTVPVIEVFLKG